jgi:hypothetical protein
MSPQQTHAPQPMVPALRAFYEPLAPYAYAFMRFCAGATIVPHGHTKLFQGAVGLLCLAICFKGGGRLSVDHAIGKEL